MTYANWSTSELPQLRLIECRRPSDDIDFENDPFDLEAEAQRILEDDERLDLAIGEAAFWDRDWRTKFIRVQRELATAETAKSEDNTLEAAKGWQELVREAARKLALSEHEIES